MANLAAGITQRRNVLHRKHTIGISHRCMQTGDIFKATLGDIHTLVAQRVRSSGARVADQRPRTKPASSNASTVAPPCVPVAPVTRIVLSFSCMRSNRTNNRAR